LKLEIEKLTLAQYDQRNAEPSTNSSETLLVEKVIQQLTPLINNVMEGCLAKLLKTGDTINQWFSTDVPQAPLRCAPTFMEEKNSNEGK